MLTLHVLASNESQGSYLETVFQHLPPVSQIQVTLSCAQLESDIQRCPGAPQSFLLTDRMTILFSRKFGRSNPTKLLRVLTTFQKLKKYGKYCNFILN